MNGGIPVALELRDRLPPMPSQQHWHAVLRVLLAAAIDLTGVAQKEIQSRSSYRTVALLWFETVLLPFPAPLTDRLAKVGELEVRNVPSEAVARRLAGEKMVKIRFHG